MHIKESLKGLCLGYGAQVTVKACWLLVLFTPLLNFKNNDDVLLYSLHFSFYHFHKDYSVYFIPTILLYTYLSCPFTFSKIKCFNTKVFFSLKAILFST